MPVSEKIKPRALKPGDTIAVCSPASAIDEDRLTRGCALIESHGYKTKLSKNIYDSNGYLAGDDQVRAADLMAAFEDPEVSAVMCSRGGYGCARLFPYIDLDKMAASGKMFMGFSDITTLHLALNRRGLVTFHTPMPITLSYDRAPWVHESFFNLLKGDATTPTDAKRAEVLVPGVAEGEVTGGCLCLLCDSIGTPDPLTTQGKILVIEDVDEYPHRIDAMFTHLLNTGILQSCAGIVIGEMTNTNDRYDPTMGGLPWETIIADRVKPLGIPTMTKFPFGHMKTMLSVPLGVRARMDTEAGTLTFLENPCA
ncbi:MAG: LD-carboxypeptidase [Chthonomonas sp.]|nr:LD-carboxypeptidase [Chthonomonas sp.]